MACSGLFRKFKIVSPKLICSSGHFSVSHAVFSQVVTLKLCGHSMQQKKYFSVVTTLPLKTTARKNPLSRLSNNGAFFMSTSTDGNQYQVVFTNPTQSSASIVDVPASTSSFNDIVNATTLTSSGSSDVAAAVENLSSSNASFLIDTQSVAQILEPSLSSLGLANWTPVGLVQMFLEYLHIACDMPWWAAIATATVIARILLLPVLVKGQKNAINMANYMPQMQFLQTKFNEARKSGNTVEASKCANDLMLFMKEKNVSPLKSTIVPLLQAPVFISFFIGLRAMASAPVESMQYGGIGWVTDLTIPDPYYITPVIACGTLYVILKVGAESGVRMENLKLTKYVLQALPVIALPFCINFPAAVVYYWVTTNFCTLTFVSILKIPAVRKALKMPVRQPVDIKYQKPKKGFVASVKEAIDDQKVLSVIEERRRMDEVRFMKAGTGPIPRTYSYDPTKPRPANAAAAAKRTTGT